MGDVGRHSLVDIYLRVFMNGIISWLALDAVMGSSLCLSVCVCVCVCLAGFVVVIKQNKSACKTNNAKPHCLAPD